MNETVVPPGRFGCPLCQERFSRLGDKKRHLRENHPRPKEPRHG